MYFCTTGYVSVTERELDCDGGKINLCIRRFQARCYFVMPECWDVLCTGKAGRMLGFIDKMFRSKLHLSVLSRAVLSE